MGGNVVDCGRKKLQNMECLVIRHFVSLGIGGRVPHPFFGLPVRVQFSVLVKFDKPRYFKYQKLVTGFFLLTSIVFCTRKIIAALVQASKYYLLLHIKSFLTIFNG